jgi:hypothetical protein
MVFGCVGITIDAPFPRRRVMNKVPMKVVMRELRSMAKKHGYEVRIYIYEALKDDSYLRFFSPRAPSGDFKQREKRIVIRRYRNTFLKSIMWVMAHEIGHLIHVVDGKFPRYYSKYWDSAVTKFYDGSPIPRKLDTSCFLQGVRAERDCDRWATKFLAERGYIYKPQRLYPATSVMGYALYSKYMERNR